MNKLSFILSIALAIIACSCGDNDGQTSHDRDLYNLRGKVSVLYVNQTLAPEGRISNRRYYFDRHGRLIAYTGRNERLIAADHWLTRDEKDRITNINFGNEWCISYAYNGNDTKPAKYKTWEPQFFKAEEVEFDDYIYDKDGNMLLNIPDMNGVENTYSVSNFDEQGNWQKADCREYGETRTIKYYPDDMFAKGSPESIAEEALQHLLKRDYEKYLEYCGIKRTVGNTFGGGDESYSYNEFLEEFISHIERARPGDFTCTGLYVVGITYDNTNNNEKATVKLIKTYAGGYAEESGIGMYLKDGKWLLYVLETPRLYYV